MEKRIILLDNVDYYEDKFIIETNASDVKIKEAVIYYLENISAVEDHSNIDFIECIRIYLVEISDFYFRKIYFKSFDCEEIGA